MATPDLGECYSRSSTNESSGGVRVLLEFDADQRLWQETVRDAVSKQCPASLMRDIAENGVDPTPLWNSYLDAGWTELTDPENAVELAIVLEELGRATDPTPFLATLTQFAPAGRATASTRSSAGTAVYSGVTANRDAEGWVLDGTDRFVLDGDRADRLAVVTPAGVFLSSTPTRSPPARVDVFDPVLHVAEVSFAGAQVRETDRAPARRHRARAPCGADGHGHHDGRRLPAHPGPGARARQEPSAVRRGDRHVPGHPAQGHRHARRDRTRPGAVLLRRADHRRRRPAPTARRRDGQGIGGGVPDAGVPARRCRLSAPWASPGRTTCSSR